MVTTSLRDLKKLQSLRRLTPPPLLQLFQITPLLAWTRGEMSFAVVAADEQLQTVNWLHCACVESIRRSQSL